MLMIQKIGVSVHETPIIHDLSLAIKPGSFHVIMGPNGSGKSTLAYALMGHPHYQVTGEMIFQGDDLNPLSAEERAKKGIFLVFQYPMEIPGVTIATFLKEMCFALHGHTLAQFQQALHTALTLLELDPALIHRSLNAGFSGGEKKRIELLQLLLAKPQFVIMDELDSGLDIDGIVIMQRVIEHMRQENPSMTGLVISHNPHVLRALAIDEVHIMREGRLIHSGTAAIISQIEQRGYDAFC